MDSVGNQKISGFPSAQLSDSLRLGGHLEGRKWRPQMGAAKRSARSGAPSTVTVERDIVNQTYGNTSNSKWRDFRLVWRTNNYYVGPGRAAIKAGFDGPIREDERVPLVDRSGSRGGRCDLRHDPDTDARWTRGLVSPYHYVSVGAASMRRNCPPRD